MNWKTLALCSVMVGVVFAGCNSSSPTPTTDTGPAPVDMGMTTMPPETHTYIIGLIQTATTDTSGTTAFGFDLDMMHNGMMGSCTDASDFTDPYDMTNMNIDNQLSTALPVLGGMLGADGADGAIRDQIEAGKILLMLTVSDINSYTNDSSVGVHALLGVVTTAACTAHTDMTSCGADTTNNCAWAANTMGGGTCNGAPMPSAACSAHSDMASCTADMMNACNWSMANSNCTGIAAGQTYMQQTDLGMVMGSITNGRLAAVTQMLPLSFVAMGHQINLVLRTVHFGGRITATNITQGEFGAQVLVSDIVSLANMLGLAVDPSTIESFVSPDLMPNMDTTAACAAHTDMASCMGDTANFCTYMTVMGMGTCMGAAAGAHCAAISAGMGYDAIAATVM